MCKRDFFRLIEYECRYGMEIPIRNGEVFVPSLSDEIASHSGLSSKDSKKTLSPRKSSGRLQLYAENLRPGKQAKCTFTLTYYGEICGIKAFSLHLCKS